MKKTYKNKLPKGMHPDKVTARVENGQVIVDVELKEEFNPKDGDFCVSDSGYIFIFKNEFTSSHFERCATCYYGIDSHGQVDYNLNYIIDHGRFAMKKEKSDFIKRLEKEYNGRWNPETKEVEKIRWRAGIGEKYYFISDSLKVISDEDLCSSEDDNRYKAGNYFRKRESAIIISERIKEIFRNSESE